MRHSAVSVLRLLDTFQRAYSVDGSHERNVDDLLHKPIQVSLQESPEADVQSTTSTLICLTIEDAGSANIYKNRAQCVAIATAWVTDGIIFLVKHRLRSKLVALRDMTLIT